MSMVSLWNFRRQQPLVSFSAYGILAVLLQNNAKAGELKYDRDADPEKLFTKLERIGKGSFGEVFKG